MDKQYYMRRLSNNVLILIGERSVLNISKEIGIPQQTLHRYLHCEREIGLENLIKIADYFGEDLDYLTGRKDF
jgi:transcriptional regulator with XRE-family HTH domain